MNDTNPALKEMFREAERMARSMNQTNESLEKILENLKILNEALGKINDK